MIFALTRRIDSTDTDADSFGIKSNRDRTVAGVAIGLDATLLTIQKKPTKKGKRR